MNFYTHEYKTYASFIAITHGDKKFPQSCKYMYDDVLQLLN